MDFPVLGRWQNEDQFRDYLAANLELLESALTLLDTEHKLPNSAGAGGRVDILAKDSLGNFVCIEVKRSDNSARATLNELSKYLVLFCRENDLPKERVRCILISTHWHEVRLPLSAFAEMSGADVSGYEAVIHDGKLRLLCQELQKIEFSPQISPEICVLYFPNEALRQKHLERVEQRIVQLPFIRSAMLYLDPTPGSNFVDYVAINYIWKIPAELHSEIEDVIGQKLGWLSPYAHPKSYVETDTAYWLFEEDDDFSTFYSASARVGTPEKVSNLLERFTFGQIHKVGRWSKSDVVNTEQKLLSQMTSFSPLMGGSKQHAYTYSAVTQPRLHKGFELEVSGFLEFLSIAPVFQAAAEKFLASFQSTETEIGLVANRGRNTFIELYLSSRSGSSQLPSFQIAVSEGDEVIGCLAGGYYWDGKTIPADPVKNMNAAFGGVSVMLLQAYSSAEWDANEDTLVMHGLIPAVFKITNGVHELVARGGDINSQVLSFADFAKINEPYLKSLVQSINSVSDLGAADFTSH